MESYGYNSLKGLKGKCFSIKIYHFVLWTIKKCLEKIYIFNKFTEHMSHYIYAELDIGTTSCFFDGVLRISALCASDDHQ